MVLALSAPSTVLDFLVTALRVPRSVSHHLVIQTPTSLPYPMSALCVVAATPGSGGPIIITLIVAIVIVILTSAVAKGSVFLVPGYAFCSCAWQTKL